MDKIFISDIRTFAIMQRNSNYRDRLFEAYNYLKSEGINTIDDFVEAENLLTGAFTYYEMTIFDRIKEEQYARSLDEAYSIITSTTVDYINNPHIGDQLASWGKLGETPYRNEYIRAGYITHGLTQEESKRYFGI